MQSIACLRYYKGQQKHQAIQKTGGVRLRRRDGYRSALGCVITDHFVDVSRSCIPLAGPRAPARFAIVPFGQWKSRDCNEPIPEATPIRQTTGREFQHCRTGLRAQVNEERLHHLLADNPLLGTVDLFAGGEVMTRFSMVAAGIFPYLLALLLVQFAAALVPRLHELQREGEGCQTRLEFISKVLTIPLAFIFAWVLSQYLSQQTGLLPGHIHWFTAESFFPSLWIVCLGLEALLPHALRSM